MHATIIPEEWQFEKEVVCFNCQTKATQVVRIKDRQGSVICSRVAHSVTMSYEA